MTQQHHFLFEWYDPFDEEYHSWPVHIDIEAQWSAAEPDIGMPAIAEILEWDVYIDDQPITQILLSRQNNLIGYDVSAYPFTSDEFTQAIDRQLDLWLETASPED